MIPLALYAAKVILISGLFLGYYTVALRNQRFHEWNRHYLLFSVIASFIIPFFRWPALASQFSTGEPLYVARLQTFTISVKPGTGDFPWTPWLGIAYALVALAFLTGIIMALVKIYLRVKHGKKKQFPRFTLVINPKTTSPFSFLHFIFWPVKTSLASREGRHILRHELVHVREKHSLDKLFMEIVIALFWTNPFFYFIRRELHTIHEFLADKKACENTVRQEYATLLVEQTVHSANVALANSFFQKQLSRRVHMLIGENTNRYTYLKRLMVIPLTMTVVCFFVFLQSHAKENKEIANHKIYSTRILPSETKTVSPKTTPVKKQASTNQPSSNASQNVSLGTSGNPIPTTHAPHKVFTFVEKMPSFPGGTRSLRSYLSKTIHYPQMARENGLQGIVVVQFIVNKDGSLGEIKTIGPKKGDGLEEEAIRSVKAMPRWEPGSQDGQPVTVQYTLPIRFQLENDAATINQLQPPPPAPTASALPSLPHKNLNKVFTLVEQMPSFGGGKDALMHYLNAHIHYPKAARENGIQGTVVVQFIVNTDGSLHDVRTVGAVKGGGLEAEALRVVKSMPSWSAGMQNGEPVAVQYDLPIRFVLQ